MNVDLARVVLRPRGPLEVFDLTLVFVRANGPVLLRLGAAVLAGPLALVTLACWLGGGSLWLLLLPLPLVPWVQAPFTVGGGRLLFVADRGARQILLETAGLGGRVLALFVGGAVGGLLSLISCGYAAVPVLAGTLFSPEVLLLERVPLAGALRRSLSLASGSAGIAFAGALGRLGLTVWGAAVGEATGQVLFGTALQLGEPFGSAMNGEITPFLLGGALAVQPLIALYRLLLYVDARTRVEGWDIQVAFRAAARARETR